MKTVSIISMAFLFLCVACKAPTAQESSGDIAYVGAKIILGTDQSPVATGVLLVGSDGKIKAVGAANGIELGDAQVVDLSGKTIIPGLINTHGHVGEVKGIDNGHYSAENIEDQLARCARYGVTTVVSLGGDKAAAVPLRNVVDPGKKHTGARLYIAGSVVSGSTPEEGVANAKINQEMGVDIIKIRVDDNLGNGTKMSPEVYRAVIEQAHVENQQLAAHMYYLEDARSLLESGADYLAHSIRDEPVDSDFIDLIKEKDVCYCATLTRDLSTFIYESEPDYFNDPFFLNEFDASIIAPLKDPQRQQSIKDRASAQTYKVSLQTALTNLKTLSDGGVTIAFGTDSGVATRFQGYFEHLEMTMMADAGMSPDKIIRSATGDAASCMKLEDVGILQTGYWADFVVLDADPLLDINNSRSINSVYVGGVSIKR